jgi:hypothetical protein
MPDPEKPKRFPATAFFRLPSGTSKKFLAPITPAKLLVMIRLPNLSGRKPFKYETAARHLDERESDRTFAFVELKRHQGPV